MSNDISPHLRSIEVQVRAAGMSMTAFLTQAGVARTTWWRWRAGRGTPNMTTWNRVQAVRQTLPLWGERGITTRTGATL